MEGLTSLSHPCIEPMPLAYDYDGDHFVVHDYTDGSTLETAIASQSKNGEPFEE
jgi:serine/threonine protein kinase